MPISMQPANLRDASYVAAHMRPIDRAEIFCQMAPDARSESLAWMALNGGGQQWCAWHEGEPIACWGWSHLHHKAGILWAWGTKDFTKAVPAITDMALNVLVPLFDEQGMQYLEARSMVGHDQAHKWLQMLGGVPSCTLPTYGSNGEDFVLFTWSRARWDDGSLKRHYRRLSRRLNEDTADWLDEMMEK